MFIIFSPTSKASQIDESSGLQFLSDHEFDLGITALDNNTNNLSSSPPLEVKSVDSLESDRGIKKIQTPNKYSNF